MSRHKIVGSEAFDRRPYVLIRSLKPGGFRRRRMRLTVILIAAGAMAAGAATTVALLALAPAIGG